MFFSTVGHNKEIWLVYLLFESEIKDFLMVKNGHKAFLAYHF